MNPNSVEKCHKQTSRRHSSDDDDSGLVADAFDVLPDENTLSFDYDSFEMDFNNESIETFSDASFAEDYEFTESDHQNEFEEEVLQRNDQNEILQQHGENGKQHQLTANHETSEITSNETRQTSPPKIITATTNEVSSKLVTFSREQARQWRRKRILSSQTQKKCPVDKNSTSNSGKPESMQPLLPLPEKLQPISAKNSKHLKDLNKSDKKIKDPLQGGEKIKHFRGPQPMKLRALPGSFWKEPTSIHTSSLAGNHYSVLPPLFSTDSNHDAEEVMSVRPVTPPDERSRSPRHSPRHKKKLVATGKPDTELLFSLFDHLENNIDERLIVRRGRPKKVYLERIPPPPRRSADGEDPCIVDDLTNKLFPELSIHNKSMTELTPNLAIVRLGRGQRKIEFPAIQKEKHYPEMLNELITHM